MKRPSLPSLSKFSFENTKVMMTVLLFLPFIYVYNAINYARQHEWGMVVSNVFFIVTTLIFALMAYMMTKLRRERDNSVELLKRDEQVINDMLRELNRLQEVNRRHSNMWAAKWREESVEEFKAREGAIWS